MEIGLVNEEGYHWKINLEWRNVVSILKMQMYSACISVYLSLLNNLKYTNLLLGLHPFYLWHHYLFKTYLMLFKFYNQHINITLRLIIKDAYYIRWSIYRINQSFNFSRLKPQKGWVFLEMEVPSRCWLRVWFVSGLFIIL